MGRGLDGGVWFEMRYERLIWSVRNQRSRLGFGATNDIFNVAVDNREERGCFYSLLVEMDPLQEFQQQGRHHSLLALGHDGRNLLLR